MTAANSLLERSFPDADTKQHYARLHAAAFDTYDLSEIPRYLTEKTYLFGNKFSFKDHEFQLDIASDTSREVNVQKCAQVGLSELMARYGLAATRVMPYFSVIMTMPYTQDAQSFCKTRMDPVIDDSPDLRDNVDKDLNNSKIKAIGTGLLYMRGTYGETAALSVPADMLIHDEVDRSDPDTLAQFQSRLKHSRWKLTRNFGTPTGEKVGIAAKMAASLRKRHMCKCDKCNHQFVPNYHDHVHIPGYDGTKDLITKHLLGGLRWQEATLLCPKCGRTPSLLHQHRSWVIENSSATYTAIGYYVAPFSVPAMVSIPDIVRESTTYNTWTEFRNQVLGETALDDKQSLTEDDLKNCRYIGDLSSSSAHCMGIDVGQICHIMIGRLDPLSKTLLVVHKERCLLGNLPTRRLELMSKYLVLMTVIDAFPETYMVQQMQLSDANLYGGVYHANPKLAVYQIVKVEEDAEAGKLPINQAKIHKNLNFDELMFMLKRKQVRWLMESDEEDNLFIAHALDMTRKQEFDKENGMVYVWEKSKEGGDHYWHTLGYLHVACRLMATAIFNMPADLPLIHTVKMPTLQETMVIGAMR